MTNFEGDQDVIDLLVDNLCVKWSRKAKATAQMISRNGLAVCLRCDATTVIGMLQKIMPILTVRGYLVDVKDLLLLSFGVKLGGIW